MPLAQPFYFGPEQRPLFGWLHQTDGAESSDVGLLICSPLGYDAISSHRTLRHLAEAAATHGIPAMRFDYDGTGNAAGLDTDPARVRAWLDSIQCAAGVLRAQTGVRRICLFGIRLGGTLALLAAQHLQVADVILVNPVIEGRRYLRELRALAATSVMTAGSEPVANDDVLEAAGFITTAETRTAINEIRLAGDSLQSAPSRVLLFERTDLPHEPSLPQRLQQLGCRLTRLDFPGYADMLRDAHETVVPGKMIQDALSWIQRESNESIAAPKAPLVDGCEFSWPCGGGPGRLREEVVRFGTADTIFGVLTQRPESIDDSAEGAPALLLLNSGAVHHVGPNRLYVRIARMLAIHGITVLRFDLPGLGDSPVPVGEAENQPYPPWATETVSQAAGYIAKRFPARALHSAGICSGAYHSLKAAVSGVPLRSIVVINPLTFFWKPGMSLATPAYQDTAEMMRYRRTGLSKASLLKLLTGKVDLANLAGILRRFALRRLRSAARNMGRRMGIALQDDLVTELRAVQAHGTRMHFVFATTDPGHSLLREQGGSEVEQLINRGVITINFVEHSDHTFTPRIAQQSLLSLLGRLFGGPGERQS
jgi:alpha-beta hydrolase superfamily lysophospholipase